MESIVSKMKEEVEDKWVRREKNLYKTSIHVGIRCALCEMEPIVGIWYKSVTWENYDLCIDCESRLGDNDIFLKIKHPEDYELYLQELKRIPGVDNAALINKLLKAQPPV